MTVEFQIADQTLTTDQLLSRLAGYQMLPKLVQEVLIDQAIAPITCTEEETTASHQRFYEQYQIVDDDARQKWKARFGMTDEQLQDRATRELRIEKFKQDTWGGKLESYFLKRKSSLDKVIYSLIRTQDAGIARELYFRILEGEQTFAELAREYSKGVEAQTDGLIGPVELSVPHPTLAQLLLSSKPGEIMPPTQVGEWIVLVRLERFMPAQMDDAMRKRLLDECFQTWLSEQLAQVDLSAIQQSVTASIAP
jgi:parvulin-like peptidyl-prolyl isomerase